MKTTLATTPKSGDNRTLAVPAAGTPLSIGDGFTARSFRARDVGPAMDPLVMVDHYVMTEDTFGTHPHAGLSAVSLLFVDSEGRFRNRDSLGNDFDLQPGDLYWLKAGRGAVHNESPRENARIHGLQVFVNVPNESRYEAPDSLWVRRKDMPALNDRQYSVRVALGESNGVVGAQAPALPMTILDGELIPGGTFEHELGSGRNAWIHAIDGELDVAVSAKSTRLHRARAIAIDNADRDESITVRISAAQHSHAQFALFDGEALKEAYVQEGPFVMGTRGEIESAKRAFAEGRSGSVD